MARSALGEIATETQQGIFGVIFSFLEFSKHGITSVLQMHVKKNNQLGCVYTVVRFGMFMKRHRFKQKHWMVRFEPFSVEADFRHHLARSIMSAPDQETRHSLESFRDAWLANQDWQLSVFPTSRPLCCKRRRRYPTFTVLDMLLN